MANLTKLKRRNSLGAPPSLEEASHNLKAPELAPVTTESSHVHLEPTAPATPVSQGEGEGEGEMPPTAPTRLDGRSLRKTGRTLQFATRVSWEFDDKLRRIAQRDRLKLVEVLEKSLDAYEQARS
jgi:hypothetical protein